MKASSVVTLGLSVRIFSNIVESILVVMVVCAQVPGVVEVNISGMETDAAVDFRAVLEAIKVTGLENAVNGSGLVNKSTSTSTVRVLRASEWLIEFLRRFLPWISSCVS